MSFEWIDVNKEKPPRGESVKVMFNIDVSRAGIKKGDTGEVNMVDDGRNGLDIEIKHGDKVRLLGTLEDITHWQKEIFEPILTRWEILDL